MSSSTSCARRSCFSTFLQVFLMVRRSSTAYIQGAAHISPALEAASLLVLRMPSQHAQGFAHCQPQEAVTVHYSTAAYLQAKLAELICPDKLAGPP